MARLEMFPLSTWIRFFSDSGSRTLDRVQEALEALENEKYTPEKFMSDAVLMWADMTTGWWTAARQTMSGPVPTAFIKILSDDQADSIGDIAVDARKEDGDIEWTAPVRLGGPDSRAPLARHAQLSHEHIEVGWHGDKQRCLRVDLHRIRPPAPKPGKARALKAPKRAKAGVAQTDTLPYAPGLYQSLVHINGKLLAQVMILVEEKIPAEKVKAAKKSAAKKSAPKKKV